jgi:hypothetical protein
VRNSHGFSSCAAYPAARFNVYHEAHACRKTESGTILGRMGENGVNTVKEAMGA